MDIQGKTGTTGQETTGTSNVIYNLVSVLYHCLKGAYTYDKYIQDAQQSGDNNLVQFFKDVQEEERRRADRCEQLLSQYLSQKVGTTGMRRAA